MAPNPATTMCATLADEWVCCGVRHAVIAPGSRSTPLALALAERSELAVHVVHDERAASFLALGIGLATGRPAVVVCTSGTAAAHFHAAVIEAHQAEVPLVVCTADRPPELRDVGAAQTVDQTRLYGAAVRWFHDPGPPDPDHAATWRPLAARAVLDATGPRPGPVHLNLPFREPLVGEAGELPPGRGGGAPWRTASSAPGVLDPQALDRLVGLLDHQRGVIVAGGGAAGAAHEIHELAGRVGWPVLADHRSGCRNGRSTAIDAFDGILRSAAFAEAHSPEVVLRIGAAPASKVLAQWLASSTARQVQVHPTTAWHDPDATADLRVVADPARLCAALGEQLVGGARTPWLARWRRADAAAQAVLDDACTGALGEPVVARLVSRHLPDGAHLVVSSSMPVRDLEWFGVGRDGLTVHANRGANGIDGVVATATGVAAATGAPTGLLIGDVAFLHDSAALVALANRGVDLRIVLVDNDGGGIFSFLPQASSLAAERFEQLFGTPHGTDLEMMCRAHRLPVATAATVDQLVARLAMPGPQVTIVRTDRADNTADHSRLNARIVAALG